LRDAHRRVAPLTAESRRRLIRQLLAITDLAKRDAELAGRRLSAFLADVEASGEPSDDLREQREGKRGP
jgi:hypothetical protein